MENHILKIEEFVNISDGYGLGHIGIFSENNRGWGYGSSSVWSNSRYGYGAGIGIETHRDGCYGIGEACIERNEYGKYR